MNTSPPSNSGSSAGTSRLGGVLVGALASRAQRIAWFGAGVACALGALTLLDSAGALPASAQGGNGNNSGNTQARPLPVTSSGVTGDSNNRMIAVTGNDITGQSVLYLIDTIDKQLAVYQASGGAPGTQNVKLVGARNISLDLQLDGLNDHTEVDKRPLTFKDLERRMNNRTDNSKTSASGVPR